MTLVTSILQGGVNSHTTTSEEANATRTDLMSPGVIGVITNTAGVAPMTGAFAVNAQGSPNMTVAVSAGIGLVTATPASGNSQLVRVNNSASTNVTIASNASGATRYDWLYINIDATKAANPAADASDVATLVTSRSTSNTTDNGTPPTYGTLLAIVTVANGAVSITNGNIAEKRVRAAAVGGINDTNGNEEIKVVATASAVNEITVTNAATANAPLIQASGDDTNIDLKVKSKGTGRVEVNGAGAAAAATVATSETTTSTSYANLTTTTDTVTVTVGNSGIVLVAISAVLFNSGANDSFVSIDVSGANTSAAADATCIRQATTSAMGIGAAFTYTGLTAGSTTFKLKYRVSAGTGTFLGRRISAVPLP